MDRTVFSHSHPRRPGAARRFGAALVAMLAALLLPATPAAADRYRDDQWHLRLYDAASAWRLSTGSGVVVAVLDSGVDATHPDLAGQVLPGRDLVEGWRDGTTDPVGHGTTVASLIAGRSDDQAGIAGLAPAAKILPVRVLDRDNKYDDAAVVADGLRWAVDRGARVVNLSLGGIGRSQALAAAISYATAHDVVVIACTGNVTPGAGGSEVWYPAREPGVVAVAGLAWSGGSGSGGAGGSDGQTLWHGSLTGPQTVLSAPAVDLQGARPGGYWRVQGTSFAAPMVAAAAALVRSRYPDMSAANVINRLIVTARDMGPEGRDDRYGYGQLDLVAALTAAVTEVSANPLVAERPTGPGSRQGWSASRRDGRETGGGTVGLGTQGTETEPSSDLAVRSGAPRGVGGMPADVAVGLLAVVMLLAAGVALSRHAHRL